jgi:hypothetical protein
VMMAITLAKIGRSIKKRENMAGLAPTQGLAGNLIAGL